MTRTGLIAGFVLMASLLLAAPPARAASATAADVANLSAQLDQLANDPTLGRYAQAQRTLARNAIAALQNAGRSDRQHALFIAQQRVALAQVSAETDAGRAKLERLQRDHDQMMLEASQADAAAARAELSRQRLQYEAAVQQAQMLEAQGAQSAQQAQQAQAEAVQAKKLAAAQGRAAALARKEARLAEAARKLQASAPSSAPAAGSAANLHLSGASFNPGSDELTGSARRRLANFARAHGSQGIVVEPRAAGDSRVLAGRRAVAVEAALSAAGAGQITVWKVGNAAQGTTIDVRAQ